MKVLKGYEGLFISSESEEKLVAMQARPLEENVRDMHVTFKFGELGCYPTEMLEKEYEVEVIGYASDGKNSGFEVKLSEELEAWYKGNRPVHITVSIGTVDGVKGKPVDTAKLDFQPLEAPFKLSAKLGYFVFGCGVCMDNSVFDE